MNPDATARNGSGGKAANREPRTRPDFGAFRRRIMISTAAFGSAVAIILVIVVQVALTRTSSNAVTSLLDDRADAVISSVDAATSGPQLEVPDARVDVGVAVYDRAGDLVAGTVPPSQARFFDELSSTPVTKRVRLGDTYEILGQPFTTSAGAHGVVVISERLQPYQENVHYALAVSIAAGGVIVVVATALAAWASRRALAPVVQMARTAENWSEHDLDSRFDLGPPTNEIRALGHTLDALLERVSQVITDEQRLTSELAHELRTPLTAVQATTDVIAMRDDLDPELRQDLFDIGQSCRDMASTITGLLDLARSQATGAGRPDADLAAVVESVLRDLDCAADVTVDLDPGVRAAVPPELAARSISPVIGNAARFADHVRISLTSHGQWLDLRVADDGPGIAAENADMIFDPGHSGGGGSGLGLALSRRVARSVGGDVRLDREYVAPAGAVFVITLPASRGRDLPAGDQAVPFR